MKRPVGRASRPPLSPHRRDACATNSSKLFGAVIHGPSAHPQIMKSLSQYANLVSPTMAEDRSSVMLRARGSSLIWTSPRTQDCCLPHGVEPDELFKAGAWQNKWRSQAGAWEREDGGADPGDRPDLGRALRSARGSAAAGRPIPRRRGDSLSRPDTAVLMHPKRRVRDAPGATAASQLSGPSRSLADLAKRRVRRALLDCRRQAA